MATVLMPRTRHTSRAVLRAIRPGNMATCSACDGPVKFAPRRHRSQVIANVYVDGTWDRVEHFHPDCYDLAHHPYGDPQS